MPGGAGEEEDVDLVRGRVRGRVRVRVRVGVGVRVRVRVTGRVRGSNMVPAHTLKASSASPAVSMPGVAKSTQAPGA